MVNIEIQKRALPARMEGSKVVVMGGSSGIGLATARGLVEAGASVIITGRNRGKLEEAANLIGASGIVCDATSADTLTDFYARLEQLDHLVLAVAGPDGGGPFARLDLGQLRRAFDDKFWAQLNAAQLSLKVLSPGGSITFITSSSARRPHPNTAGLAAINGALESTVKTLATELGPVRVNAVSPGVVDTPFWDRMPANQKAKMLATLGQAALVGRVGKPEEIADAVLFVIGNRFITGTVIECDGGLGLA